MGEQLNHISTGVHGRHRSLVTIGGPTLAALDHDLPLFRIVPSALAIEIPYPPNDSSFSGQPFVSERKKKEKRVGIKYLNKRKYCVGTDPSALVYIGILVTSTTTGHDGSVVSAFASQALASQAKGSIPSCGMSFFFPKVFSIFPFQPLSN